MPKTGWLCQFDDTKPLDRRATVELTAQPVSAAGTKWMDNDNRMTQGIVCIVSFIKHSSFALLCVQASVIIAGQVS